MAEGDDYFTIALVALDKLSLRELKNILPYISAKQRVLEYEASTEMDAQVASMGWGKSSEPASAFVPTRASDTLLNLVNAMSGESPQQFAERYEREMQRILKKRPQLGRWAAKREAIAKLKRKEK